MIALALAVALLLGCTGGGQTGQSSAPTPLPKAAAPTVPPGPAAQPPAPSPSPAATTVVRMGDAVFIPDQITVTVGTTVTWDNADLSTHTVTADDGSFDSGTEPPKWLQSGQKYSFAFAKAGTYPYHCIPHQQIGMVGTVVVQ